MAKCCVCFGDKGSKLSCNHSICDECSTRWRAISNTCPLCRQTIIDKPKCVFVFVYGLIVILLMLDCVVACVDFFQPPRFERSRQESITYSILFSAVLILCNVLGMTKIKLYSFVFPILKLSITIFYFGYQHFDPLPHISLLWVFILRGCTAIAACFAFPMFYHFRPKTNSTTSQG